MDGGRREGKAEHSGGGKEGVGVGWRGGGGARTVGVALGAEQGVASRGAQRWRPAVLGVACAAVAGSVSA